MDTKIILNPTIARQLLHYNNPIIDIKPKKENPRETIFIFEVNEKFNNDLKKILDKK